MLPMNLIRITYQLRIEMGIAGLRDKCPVLITLTIYHYLFIIGFSANRALLFSFLFLFDKVDILPHLSNLMVCCYPYWISINKRLCPSILLRHTFLIIMIFSNIYFGSAVCLFLEGEAYNFRINSDKIKMAETFWFRWNENVSLKWKPQSLWEERPT